MTPNEISFFQRFENDILAGKKTITIRDDSEKDYKANSIVKVYTFETNRWFCDVMIENVQPIHFDQLSDTHAKQENMTLEQLKQVIRDIYPGVNELYVISFQLV